MCGTMFGLPQIYPEEFHPDVPYFDWCGQLMPMEYAFWAPSVSETRAMQYAQYGHYDIYDYTLTHFFQSVEIAFLRKLHWVLNAAGQIAREFSHSSDYYTDSSGNSSGSLNNSNQSTDCMHHTLGRLGLNIQTASNMYQNLLQFQIGHQMIVDAEKHNVANAQSNAAANIPFFPPTHSTPKKVLHCKYCKKNGESHAVYASHRTKDAQGNTTCPILMAHVCEICGATGNRAHSKTYCPMYVAENAKEERDYRLTANGKLSRSRNHK